MAENGFQRFETSKKPFSEFSFLTIFHLLFFNNWKTWISILGNKIILDSTHLCVYCLLNSYFILHLNFQEILVKSAKNKIFPPYFQALVLVSLGRRWNRYFFCWELSSIPDLIFFFIGGITMFTVFGIIRFWMSITEKIIQHL